MNWWVFNCFLFSCCFYLLGHVFSFVPRCHCCGLPLLDKMCHVCVLKCHPHLFQVSTHGYSQNQILVWKYPSLTQVAKLTGHSYRVLYLVSEIIRVFSRFTETALLFEMNLEAVIRAWSYNLLADWDFPKLQINNVLYFSSSVRLHNWIVWISGHLCDKNKLYIYPELS